MTISFSDVQLGKRREVYMAKVGLVKGEDRFTNVLRALENAGEEVRRKIHGRVLIHGVREFGRDENLVACTRTIHNNLHSPTSF
jgi:hypothetical protein